MVFGAIYAAEGTLPEALEAIAREFSPRVEAHRRPAEAGRPGSAGSLRRVAAQPREVTLDLSGLERLFGDARTIAEELRRTAADRGVRVRVAIAGTRTAARLLVHHRAGITVVPPGTEQATLAPLPLRLLSTLHDPNDPNDRLATLCHWGIRTLGELADLPPDDLAARLGQEGVGWQRLARGEDPHPLVPAVPEERFEQALDLEWPIEGLEPLSFVLGRLIEPLAAHLERRGRGAAVLHLRLHLIKTGATREVHERSIQLPTPIRDARTLRTLTLLDLESHPPAAAIDRVIVAVDPTPERIVQFSLLTRPLPSPEQLSTLLARLGALMGEGRSGAPALVDTWRPGAFAMQPFAPREPDIHKPRSHKDTKNTNIQTLRAAVSPWPVMAIRRCRFPVPVRVRLDASRPVRVTVDRAGFTSGRVTTAAGPWRTSGAWWQGRGEPSPWTSPPSPLPPPPWDRDEWDLTLHDGVTYRVFHERDTGGWFLEGILD